MFHFTDNSRHVQTLFGLSYELFYSAGLTNLIYQLSVEVSNASKENNQIIFHGFNKVNLNLSSPTSYFALPPLYCHKQTFNRFCGSQRILGIHSTSRFGSVGEL